MTMPEKTTTLPVHPLERLVSWLREEREVIKGSDIDSVIAQATKLIGDEEGKEWAVKKPLFVSGRGFKIILRKKTIEEIEKSRQRREWRAEMSKRFAS